MVNIFKNKKILITGGDGSLGKALTKRLLTLSPHSIRIFSRDELKQYNMSQELKNNKLRFLVGNVRDKERLDMAFEEVNLVFHCAAMKRIEACESNPFESVKTNIIGTQNAVECALKQSTVEKFVSISSDKSVESQNTYGSTKHLQEKITISAMFYRGRKPIKFFVTRIGNVMGSRGSVLPIFLNQIKQDKTLITDLKMTRFTITMKENVDFILNCMNFACGGEVFIPKLRAYRILDFAHAMQSIDPDFSKSLKAINIKEVGIRSGEKLHETLIGRYEMRDVLEAENLFIILPSRELIKKYGLKFDYPFKTWNPKIMRYTSDSVEFLSVRELKDLIKTVVK